MGVWKKTDRDHLLVRTMKANDLVIPIIGPIIIPIIIHGIAPPMHGTLYCIYEGFYYNVYILFKNDNLCITWDNGNRD